VLPRHDCPKCGGNRNDVPCAYPDFNFRDCPMTKDEALVLLSESLVLLSQKLTDQGRLIEAGWVGFQIAVVPPDAPDVQVREMRLAFMAGAQHLFSSITAILEADREPTEADMRRMSLIDDELKAFTEEFKKRTH